MWCVPVTGRTFTSLTVKSSAFFNEIFSQFSVKESRLNMIWQGRYSLHPVDNFITGGIQYEDQQVAKHVKVVVLGRQTFT